MLKAKPPSVKPTAPSVKAKPPLVKKGARGWFVHPRLREERANP
jgi:hypothetical protein